ncbi:MAG: hypothetical protein ACMUEL_00305 [Flavobacteriales bacterium Tduv]
MRLIVYSIAANEYDSRCLKLLISKLEYKLRKVYAEKGYQVPANGITFIVKSSKTVYRRNSIGNRPLSSILYYSI